MEYSIKCKVIKVLKNIYLFLKRGERMEKENEKSTDVREKHP